MGFILMKGKDIKPLKEKLWMANNKKCPILDVEIPLDKMVLDHAHKKKAEPYSEQKGTIREALEFRVNAFFGKIENSFRRFGLEKEFSIADVLERGVAYFRKGSYKDENGDYHVHPSEIPKEKKLAKRPFNKIKKLYSQEFPKKKPLEYPKSKKPTKLIKKLAEKYGVAL